MIPQCTWNPGRPEGRRRLKPAQPLLLFLAAALTISAQEYRAFWADAFHAGYKTPAEVDKMIDDVVAARGNAIIIEVRVNGGTYYFNSFEPPAEDREYPPGFDALEYTIRRAHERGIEVHAWFAVLPLWRSTSAQPQDPRHPWYAHGPNAKGEEMWMSLTATGKASGSVDPGHPAVLAYLADMMVDVAQRYEVDGIHLDYIRYAEDDDYGWNPKAVERFQRQENRVGQPVRAEARWSSFRRQQVTALVRQTYLRMIAARPQAKLSAALICWGNGPLTTAAFNSTDAYARVFQDWRGWLEEGILDIGIPMNYFREPTNASFLDRWLEFEKDRQYGRVSLVGLGVYLNSIADSMAQVGRGMAPSAAGNKLAGVTYYSYASTNNATRPNSEFYAAVGKLFGTPATPPVLAWKATPERGHLMGRLTVDEAPEWMKDGATILIESDTGQDFLRRATTDATGFFGSVDLPVDRYRLRLERGGIEVYRTVAQDVKAGAVTEFPIRLKGEDFAPALPRVTSASTAAAAPGEQIDLEGLALGLVEGAFASNVPLPFDLGGTQVLVNGAPAPLFHVLQNRIELQLPYATAEQWNIVVRRAGMESAVFPLPVAEANPVIVGVRHVGGYLEIYATGLGATDPSIPAGTGGPAGEPLARVKLPVRVLIGDVELMPAYAGLQPYQPARYQVNVELPAGMTEGELRLKVGDAVSGSVRF